MKHSLEVQCHVNQSRYVIHPNPTLTQPFHGLTYPYLSDHVPINPKDMCVNLIIRLPSDQDPVNPALFYSKYSILEFTNPSTKSITFVPLQNTKGRQEAGGNMICEIQVLDGCIHDECGRELPTYLQNLPMMGVDGV